MTAQSGEHTLQNVKRVVVTVAVLVALGGIVAAIATQSLWPLLCSAGLLIPLFPLETPMTRGRRS